MDANNIELFRESTRNLRIFKLSFFSASTWLCKHAKRRLYFGCFLVEISAIGFLFFSVVQRWTRRQKVDLFEKDLIFIPLHLGQLHWTLGVIDMR